jgi:hypothetical protein
MLRKEPVMAIEVFDSILPFAIFGFVEILDDFCTLCLRSYEVSVDIGDEDGQALSTLSAGNGCSIQPLDSSRGLRAQNDGLGWAIGGLNLIRSLFPPTLSQTARQDGTPVFVLLLKRTGLATARLRTNIVRAGPSTPLRMTTFFIAADADFYCY